MNDLATRLRRLADTRRRGHSVHPDVLREAANTIDNLTAERDEARRIAAYQYAKHSNYGDESFAMKNFFQFHKWEYLKEDGK
jgi:hypothetical protein